MEVPWKGHLRSENRLFIKLKRTLVKVKVKRVLDSKHIKRGLCHGKKGLYV